MFRIISVNPLRLISLKEGKAFWSDGRTHTFPAGRVIDVLELGPNGELIVFKKNVSHLYLPPTVLVYAEPEKKTLFGIHGRADGRLEEPDLAVIRLIKAEAVKLLSTAAPEDVDRLRAIKPDMFIMVRMYADFSGRVVHPDDFASWMAGDLRGFYERGVRYFEVHNEPNLVEEGWQASWKNGHEFAEWFMRVRQNLVAIYPQMKFGFPGLSPNSIPTPTRADDKVFFREAELAVKSSDFVCAHAYWQSREEMRSPLGGMSWVHFQNAAFGKEFFITECSNPNPKISQSDRGQQYLDYYNLVRQTGSVKALFYFVVSASSGFSSETWRDENGILKNEAITVFNGRR